MPYLSTEHAKEIRNKIKKEFPEFKFSIRKDHSSIRITILSGPREMLTYGKDKGYEDVNHFYIADHYEETPEIRDILLRIYEIANKGNYTEVYDGDYGAVPSFYVNMSIGDWERPYIKIPKIEEGEERHQHRYRVYEDGSIKCVDCGKINKGC